MNGKLIRLSIIGMTGNYEYDAIGELFRQRLEYHRMPVDDNDWDEIKRRLGRRKKKAVIWLWIAGTMTTAATIAALLIVTPVTSDTAVAVATEESVPAHHELIPSIMVQETTEAAQIETGDSPAQNHSLAVFQSTGKENQTNTAEFIALLDIPLLPSASPSGVNDSMIAFGEPFGVQSLSDSVTQSLSDSVTPLLSDPVIEKVIPILDVSLVADLFEDDETATKKRNKWLFAAAFGLSGGYSDSFSNSYGFAMNSPHPGDPSLEMGLSGDGNKFAADLSNNIPSFRYMTRETFTNISHQPPFSFGLTAHKSLGKHGGVESGLVYTYLSSRFEWQDYDARQSLHYVGIPVNLVVYLWNSKTNWRVYLSGGMMAEKGLRAIYRQERRWGNEIQNTTVKKSSIDGWQWSLNSALGINYRIDKGFGIYFEPRVGYSFDCNQPVSIRTEWPVYIGIHLGLNYEL